MRYIGSRQNGRPLYEDSAGRVIAWATPSGHAPSSRRFVVSQSGWQTRARWAGNEVIGEELARVNIPRRMRQRVDMYALLDSRATRGREILRRALD